MKNLAYIDWQNFYLWTTRTEGWFKVDLVKFRRYLREKYNIENAYYFLGYLQDDNTEMYTRLQESGFIVVFKKQVLESKSNKKGNIDSDLIFRVMEKLIVEPENFNKILLVSGDGDFKILVDFLIGQNRFLKILFPNKHFASSLYKDLSRRYYDYIFNIRKKIEYQKRT
jgi:uncharacterized LabA/DUF88 family protein